MIPRTPPETNQTVRTALKRSRPALLLAKIFWTAKPIA
jgi:hypothetical protein